ncbi:hypothetical protein F4821DRAFT_118301 [Hypoxylon rubiginosum]|uniref:Uncharacterized protein n=1 Tax=Hypoxylon rubiginosum TaxID=110542 RepID=A0ACC0D3D5_9PEZI|nr:hypothetical protein F4821DRAFT_118301 [Hypoxylon rubiginosum]
MDRLGWLLYQADRDQGLRLVPSFLFFFVFFTQHIFLLSICAGQVLFDSNDTSGVREHISRREIASTIRICIITWLIGGVFWVLACSLETSRPSRWLGFRHRIFVYGVVAVVNFFFQREPDLRRVERAFTGHIHTTPIHPDNNFLKLALCLCCCVLHVNPYV